MSDSAFFWLAAFPGPPSALGGFGLRDDGLKVTVIDVAEHLGEGAAGQESVARRVSAVDGFKGRDFLAYKVISSGFWFTRRREVLVISHNAFTAFLKSVGAEIDEQTQW